MAELTEPAARTKSRPNPYGVMGVAVVVYGTAPVFIAASRLDGVVFSFWRMLVALPIVAAIAYVAMRVRQRNSGRLRPSVWRIWWRATVGAPQIVAGLALAVNQVLIMTALNRVSVVDVTLVGTLSPLLTGAGAALVLAERTSLSFWGWTAVAMGGTALVVAGGMRGPGGDPLGLALALLGTAMFSVFMIASKISATVVDPSSFTFGSTLWGTLVVSLGSALFRVDVSLPSVSQALCVLGVVVGGGTFGHVLFVWALQRTSATFGSVARLSHPFVAGSLAWLFLGQTVTLWHLVGGLVTIVGVAGAGLALRTPTVVAGPDPVSAEPTVDGRIVPLPEGPGADKPLT
jgi:drug/metabolite transporter (DMT)-like permease